MTCAASDNRFRESILKLFRNPHPEHGRDHLLARDARFQSECAVHSGAPDPEYDLDKTIGVRELDPVSTEQYFEWQNRSVLPQSANLSSLLCMGHMVGPVPAFVALLSESVASLNQNLVKREVSRSFTALERRAIAVLHRLVFQKPEAFYRLDAAASQSTLGMLCTGGTVANLTALWIARNSCFPPSEDFAGWNKLVFPPAWRVTAMMARSGLMCEMIGARGDFELLFDAAPNVVLYRHIPELLRSREPRRSSARTIDFSTASTRSCRRLSPPPEKHTCPGQRWKTLFTACERPSLHSVPLSPTLLLRSATCIRYSRTRRSSAQGWSDREM